MSLNNNIIRTPDLSRLNLECILAQPNIFRPIFMCGSAAFERHNFALLSIIYELNYDHLRQAIRACRPELTRAANLFPNTLEHFREYIMLASRHHTTLSYNNFNIVVTQSESNIDFLQRQCAIDTYEDWDLDLELPIINPAFDISHVGRLNQQASNDVPECITIGSSSISDEFQPADSTTQNHEDVI